MEGQAQNSQKQPFQVLLYYNFVKVADPAAIVEEQVAFCEKHNLLGRILVAEEGINGTVSGPVQDTEAYMDFMRNHPIFKGIEFKIDPVPGHTFNKLHVRVKNEIVHLGAEDVDATKPSANYVEPEEWREMLKNKSDDVVILDARSNYETAVGKFKGALTLDIDNFRELPEKIAELEHLKDKTIYTYCTGGIKCEKVSELMHKVGFDKVYQLHGGIIRYAHETGGEDFQGACYVFDQRVVVPVNNVNPEVIGHCMLCDGPTETMINCANPDCNKHFLICEDCANEKEGCCSDECHEHPRRRTYDGRGYYLRGVNSKLYHQNPDPNYLRNLETNCKETVS